MSASITFLGTGSSMGVPVIACSCDVCLSPHPKNKRCRPSALLKVKNKNILVDAGPDLRFQALRAHLKSLDGIILTHTHFDHTGGLDDLRIFSFLHEKTVPCLLLEESQKDLQVRFPYFFTQRKIEQEEGRKERFSFTVLKEEFGKVDFLGVEIETFTFTQSHMKVLGFRLGNMAYVLDIKEFSEEVIYALQGVEILVLSALRHTASPAHFSLDEAISFSQLVGAKRTYLSHMAHEVEHEAVSEELATKAPSVELAYDGLEVFFDY